MEIPFLAHTAGGVRGTGDTECRQKRRRPVRRAHVGIADRPLPPPFPKSAAPNPVPTLRWGGGPPPQPGIPEGAFRATTKAAYMEPEALDYSGALAKLLEMLDRRVEVTLRETGRKTCYSPTSRER